MSDPAGLRDEAVVTLNELLYLNVGRHPDPLECALERDRGLWCHGDDAVARRKWLHKIFHNALRQSSPSLESGERRIPRRPTNIRISGVLLRRTAAVKYPVISVRMSVHDANPRLPGDRRTARSRHRPAAEASPTGPHLAALSLTTLGVVYGDIGTSPLYALRACFNAEYGLAPTSSTVYGVLSLIVWSLILIVSLKYIIVVMRLDNHGEGGIVALLALLRQKRRRGVLLALGLFGAAPLSGDGVITPAISVLTAAEGPKVATPAFNPSVLPSTLLILFLLFFVQKYGTARVGSVFGPIMLV